MKVTTLLLISAQVFLAIAGRSRGNKEPEITSIACNDPAAEAAADLSLRQLNANRREGSVLGLKRISNVQQQFDEENGFVFYLTLDVLETKCHVLSRQLWKDCGAKPRHEAVFGQCKVIFHLNKPKRIAFLQNYDCTLSPAARDGFGCAGCHFSIPLNDSNIEKVAEMSLEKFNKESDYNKYFVLGNITKGARQVVAGTAYHVEFTIHESICNKSAEDFSLCDPLDCEFAHSGYCQGMAVWSIQGQDNVNNVKCEIFEPEAAVVEEQKYNEGHPTDQPINDKKDHEKHGDRGRGKKHGHRRGHGHAKHGDKHWHKHDHKHDHNHDSGSHEHDHEHLHNYEHHHSQPQRSRGPPFHPPKTLGTITYLSENEKTTTDSPVEQEKKGKGRKPDRKWEGRPSKSFIRPFPEKASTSDQCPGPAMNLPVTENFPRIEGTQDPTRLDMI